jgi:hypothetical protein
MSEKNFEPVAVSVMISDLVICEQGTGKNSLIGCFNNFNFPSFPFPTTPFYVTVALTNLLPSIKSYDVIVRIEDPKNGNVLRNAGTHLELSDPVVLTKEIVIEVPVPVMPFLIPQPGHYVILVLVNNEQAGKRLLTITSLTALATPPK